MIGALPRRVATEAQSMVADMTSSFRSGRTSCCTSRHRARARSAFRLRSWNSSNITSEMPSRQGSRCRRRVRIPSVTTSIRVAGETLRSNRMAYPTVSPTFSPRDSAIRCAAWTAASRRGSSITIRPPPRPGRFNRASGTRLVFPAPGGAWSTVFDEPDTTCLNLGSTGSIGRGEYGLTN